MRIKNKKYITLSYKASLINNMFLDDKQYILLKQNAQRIIDKIF